MHLPLDVGDAATRVLLRARRDRAREGGRERRTKSLQFVPQRNLPCSAPTKFSNRHLPKICSRKSLLPSLAPLKKWELKRLAQFYRKFQLQSILFLAAIITRYYVLTSTPRNPPCIIGRGDGEEEEQLISHRQLYTNQRH